MGFAQSSTSHALLHSSVNSKVCGTAQVMCCLQVLADTWSEASASQNLALAGSAAELGEGGTASAVSEAGHSPTPASGSAPPSRPAAGQLLPDKSKDAAEAEVKRGRAVRYAVTFQEGGCGTAGPGSTYLQTISEFKLPPTPAYSRLKSYSVSKLICTDAAADWGAGPPGQTGQEAWPPLQKLQKQLVALSFGGQQDPEAMPWQWLLLDMLAAMPADSCGRQCLQEVGCLIQCCDAGAQ